MAIDLQKLPLVCLSPGPTILVFRIAQQQQLQKENGQGSALTPLSAFNSPCRSESGVCASQEQALLTSPLKKADLNQ